MGEAGLPKILRLRPFLSPLRRSLGRPIGLLVALDTCVGRRPSDTEGVTPAVQLVR